MSNEKTDVNEIFAKVATKASEAAGSVWAFSLAALIVLVWAATGPIFHFSEVWQLVINTGTTIVTFLMVFVIQHAQNKDTRAVHLKLNELIAAVEGASNRLIDVEDLSDRELERLYERFQQLAKNAAKVSSGAKLTVESDADCGPAGPSKSEPASDAAKPSSGKSVIPIKKEALGRKQQKGQRGGNAT